MNYNEFIQGFLIGLSLIIAIGPQNLFIINQGLKKSYIFSVCLICSLSDSILIIIGILTSSFIIEISPNIVFSLKIIGGIWLIFYGIMKIKNSFIKKDNLINQNEKINSVIVTTLILTFVNPHVYLDTVVLIGAISLNFENKISFGLGTIIASFIFFYSLGYFSKFIIKFIEKNIWIWIDLIFGILMIVYGLIFILTSL